MAGYEVTLDAAPMIVEWGAFTPASPEMKVVRGPLVDSLSFYVAVEGQRPLPRGKHRLGSVTLKLRRGHPTSLNIAPCAFIGDTTATSFRSDRRGRRLRLGPTVAFASGPTVIQGEWYDVSGVQFSTPPRPSVGAVLVDSGILYLGWHRMTPPYELSVLEGRAVVNGLTLPEKTRAYGPRPEIPEHGRASYTADVFAFAVARTLHGLAIPDSEVVKGTASAYRLSPSVDSVFVGRSLHVHHRGERVWSLVRLPRWSEWPRWLDPKDLAADMVDDWARHLARGSFIRIEGVGFETLAPRGRGEEIDWAIRALQGGHALSPGDSVALRTVEPNVDQWDVIARPEPLDRVRR